MGDSSYCKLNLDVTPFAVNSAPEATRMHGFILFFQMVPRSMFRVIGEAWLISMCAFPVRHVSDIQEDVIAHSDLAQITDLATLICLEVKL